MVSRVDDDGFYRLLTEGLAELQGSAPSPFPMRSGPWISPRRPACRSGVGLSGGLLDFEFETEGGSTRAS